MYISPYFLKRAFLHCWPKIFLSTKREQFKSNLRKIPVQQRKFEMASDRLQGKTRVDPWAFIRVKDEKVTLLASLNSILPVIHKGVIAYNDCTDGSDRIIERFCLDNPGFIPFKYPFYVEPAGSRRYETGNLREENTLAAYYNAALEVIPKNEWIIKIDVDQIYFPRILEHSFFLPKSNKDIVSYSRLNVVRDKNNRVRVEKYLRPGDHWLIFNDKINFTNVFGYSESGEFYSWEHMQWEGDKNPIFFKPECSSLHFPYEKNYRSYMGNPEDLTLLEDFFISCDKTEFSNELLNVRSAINMFEE